MSDTRHVILVDLPEGAVVEHSITIVSYLHPDGSSYTVQTDGEGLLSTTLGLMEIAKARLIGAT